jgi:hypothetical protein
MSTDQATVSSVHGRRIRMLIGLQLYVVAAYLFGAVLPYVWRGHGKVPTWLIFVPGMLLGVPGFFIAVYGQLLVLALALAGVVVLAVTRWRGWLVAGTVALGALGAFMLTPLGETIRVYVLD